MSNYVEIPRKPATVRAIQYVGMENGVPLFNEPAPSWIVGALAKGTLKVVDGGLHCKGMSLDLGSWLLVNENDAVGDGMWSALAADFLAGYRPARKKVVNRKPRALKAAA